MGVASHANRSVAPVLLGDPLDRIVAVFCVRAAHDLHHAF